MKLPTAIREHGTIRAIRPMRNIDPDRGPGLPGGRKPEQPDSGFPPFSIAWWMCFDRCRRWKDSCDATCNTLEEESPLQRKCRDICASGQVECGKSCGL